MRDEHHHVGNMFWNMLQPRVSFTLTIGNTGESMSHAPHLFLGNNFWGVTKPLHEMMYHEDSFQNVFTMAGASGRER